MSDMVITCPECGTSYKADSASIGENGRTVRCARCQETWFVPSPSVTPLKQTDPDALALADAQAEDAERLKDRITAPAPVVPAAQGLDPAPTADVLLRDQADAAKLARRRRTIRLIWIVTALLAIAAIAVAYLNRQEIVNRQPKAATLYQAVGIEVRENGLEIDPPMAKTALVDGRPVIRVEGAVRNLSRRTRDLPLIELSLHDGTGQTLVQWYVEPAQATLAGQGRLPFTTEYADPPDSVTGLRYRFAEQ